MQVTEYSICMTVLWSSILISVFYLLRKKAHLISVCSISGVIILYIFCLVRMFVPVEFPWTRVVSGGNVYNFFYKIIHHRVFTGMPVTLFQISLIIWTAGTVISLFRYVKNYTCFSNYLNKLDVIDDELTVHTLRKISSGGESIKVVRSSFIETPCCIGIIKKKIILPMKNYSEDDLYYILLHEYSHLKNKDLLVKMLINILCAVYWWNPFVYLLKKDINQTLEIRCDDLVIKEILPNQRADYLSVLLKEFQEITEESQLRKYRNFISQFHDFYSGELLERFKIVSLRNDNKYWQNEIVAYVIAIILLVFSYSFIFQTQFEVPSSDIETENGVYEIDNDNSYIFIDKSGEYILHTDSMDFVIDKEMLNRLLDEGFDIREN